MNNAPIIRKKTPSYRASQGVVLIVALVLLLALTLIGVSAIDSSSLQSQMSRNSLYARNLYQASLSEIQAQREKMRGTERLENIVKSPTQYVATSYEGISFDGPGLDLGAGSPNLLETDNNAAYTYSGYVVFSGEGPPPSGYSLKLYKGMNYEINIITQVTNTTSISNQTQGVKGPAPKDQQ